MDPLTQMSVGAAAAVALTREKGEVRHALILGALAGAAPDLDVLIRSDSDPLLALEYHRHFTHALLFAPIIGASVAGLYKIIFALRLPIQRILLFGVIATLTHGLIDACTSYGTLLYWPFHSHRESWDIISIIDPIFTVPLVIFLIFAWCWRSYQCARWGLFFACLYFIFGVYQREQARGFAYALANERGHAPKQLTARPSFGNILLWRLVYRDGDRYHVDAVRTFPGFEDRHYPGGTVNHFGKDDINELLQPDSVLANDIERFRFFSQGYLFLSGDSPLVAGDLRYAMFPDSVTPLWGVHVDTSRPQSHTDLVYFRNASGAAFNRLWDMICGREVLPLLDERR